LDNLGVMGYINSFVVLRFVPSTLLRWYSVNAGTDIAWKGKSMTHRNWVLQVYMCDNTLGIFLPHKILNKQTRFTIEWEKKLMWFQKNHSVEDNYSSMKEVRWVSLFAIR
jgi:hypothetical protein